MDNLFNGIYKNKKVLITGHTGFKGSWLALWLTKLGAEVIGYSKDIPTNPSHFELLKLPIVSISGDILDKEKLFDVINEHKPDIVFHLAAQSLVRKSYIEPINTFEVNILGTLNVLESCRKVGTIKAIVNITSDKCYHNDESGLSYKEDDKLGGDDPYSASKGAVEIVSQSYRNSFFPKEGYGVSHNTLTANARAGNVIGGGDWAEDRLIPDIMRAVKDGKEVTIRNPNSIRPWQHVLEPLHGYLKLGEKLLNKEIYFADNWNFGPSENSHISVGELTKYMKVGWDKINFKIEENTNNYNEAKTLKLDSTKSQKYLGCKSVWNTEETINKTVSWYKKYYEEGAIMSEDDLNSYINKI